MTTGKQAEQGGAGRPPVRTIVLDDQLVFRLGLRMYLASRMGELEWLGEADSVEGGLALAERVRPDLILIDAFLGESIEKTLGELRLRAPDARIVVLANIADSHNLALAAGAGANGYLLKTLAPDAMVEALREVGRGATYIQPELTQQLYADFARRAAAPESVPTGVVDLTPRQIEVLRLVAQGMRNSEIAERLTISEQTVKTHVAHLLEKLGVSSRLQAARYAISKKLVDA